MNIVVLDGHTLNPGDLSWDLLEQLGEVKVYSRSTLDNTLARCDGADVLLTNKTTLNAHIISKLKHVKYIGVLATGYNVVDIEAAKANNIVVTNIPAYGSSSVAQHTFALLLALTNQVALHDKSVVDGQWGNQGDFCYTLAPLTDLSDKTFGVIGYGNIGKQVAEIAQSFGMNVLISSHSADNVQVGQLVSQSELVKRSDIISLHCALTSENKGLINNTFISNMKTGAIIINTSRGPLINETDLVEALKSGKVGGAALDVLSEEPPTNGNALIGLPNCIVTPHIAWATQEARTNLLSIAVKNIEAFLNGKPINVIN